MDDIVRQAMAKWPNVPHCYGWLALDARGFWRMRDDRAQSQNLPGDKIANAALLGFINRNYTHDGEGNWYFQNGPQRVYVDLEATPYIARTDPAQGFLLQTGEPLGAIEAAWITESGSLLLQGGTKRVAQLDDRDVAQCLPLLRMSGAPVDDDTLVSWLAAPSSADRLEMRQGERSILVERLMASDIPGKFGFVKRPKKPSA